MNVQRIREYIQGVSKKRYFLDFLSYFSSRGRILLFHMCFGIRILSPFHLAIQKVSIQNLNCPKNACADMIFIPALRSEDWAGIKIMSAHAFLAFTVYCLLYCLLYLINKLRELVNLGNPFFSNPNSQKLLWGTSQKTPCITFLRRFPHQSQNLTEFPHTLCPGPICCRFRRTLLSTSSRLGPSSQSTIVQGQGLLVC